MIRKIHQDVIVGLIFILLSVFFYFKSLDIIFKAALFPRIILALLVLFGILILLKGISKSKSISNEENLYPEEEEEKLGWDVLSSPIFVLILTIAFVSLIGLVGFYVATIALFPVLMIYMKAKNWKVIILTIIGFNLFIYLVFTIALNVPLPKGVIF